MSEKKYFWLKLQRDFFKRHDIRIIEDMENGKDYILFYLKLLVESIDHEGNLRFSDTIPYNEKMLSTITNTNIDIVRSALEIFTNLGMMERLDDGTIYMSEVNKMIGSEGASAKWMRDKRARDNHKLITSASQCDLSDAQSDIEIEKDIDKEQEIRIRVRNQEREYEEKDEPTIRLSYLDDSAPVKRAYGETQNVLLSNEDFKNLKEKFGLPTLIDYINRLSDYMTRNNKMYSNHADVISRWITRDQERKDG